MGQLPDFTKVSDEVAEEHWQRLSAAMEHARKQAQLKSYIFTGTAPGTGVTTVVSRVRDTLEAMGRPAVVVNASEIPPQTAGASGTQEPQAQANSEQGSRSTALLRQVSQQAGMKDESLVLIDAAPLEISAETEYLARFADCVIVVIEAGVTTRAELRAVVQILQRLNVGTAGFVLNRMRLAKAEPAFRQSVSAMERRLRAQGRSTAGRTAGGPLLEEESSPAAEQEIREAAAVAPPEPAVTAPVAATRRAAPAEPEWAGIAAAPAPLPPPAVRAPRVQKAPPPVPEPDSDIPWWLSETYRQPSAPAARRLWQPVKTSLARGAGAQDAQQPAPEEASGAATSRLSPLRDIFFSRGSNDLNRANEAVAKDEETVSPEIEPHRPAQAHVFVPTPEPLPAADASPRAVIAAPESLPPKPAAPLIGRGHAWENEQPARLDRREVLDEVAILPSWRGQYSRKD